MAEEPRRRRAASERARVARAAASPGMERIEFTVPQIQCPACARRVRSSLDRAGGVRAVAVDVTGRQVSVDYDPSRTTAEAIRGEIERAGFPAEGASAPAAEAGRARGSPALWYGALALGVAILAIAGYLGYELYPRFDLPAAQGIGLFFLAAGAGIASFFSPCAFPLLVTLLARETGVERGAVRPREALARSLTFAAALSVGAAAFLLVTGALIALGGGPIFAGVTFTSGAAMVIRAIVGLFLIALGLAQLGVLPYPLHAVEHWARPLLRAHARFRRRNAVLGLGLFGFGYLLAGFG